MSVSPDKTKNNDHLTHYDVAVMQNTHETLLPIHTISIVVKPSDILIPSRQSQFVRPQQQQRLTE